MAAEQPRLTMAQMAFAAHDYTGALGHAKAAYDLVAEGAALAGAPATIVEPSTWTVVGPVKNGNGPRAKKVDFAKDLDEKANVKRMFGK